MTKIHSNDTKAGTLHDKALALLKNKPSESGSVAEYVNDTILKLIHEVEVHQIELELQNEELLTARTIAQKSSEKYIELYDFAPSGYITLSKTGEIIDLNFSGANLLGKSREQLKKSHLAFFISHETKPIFQHFLENIFKNNMKESCEVIFIPENSEPLFVNISGITTENSEQCLLNLVDVTEYLKTQELIIEKNNQLALQNQELEKRAAELLLINKELAFQIYEKYLLETKLIIAKEKAEESERLKSSFLANMSHEIRTPMNGILGFMQLLKTPVLTPEKQLKYISMIEMGGERMLEIINDIIDISKIQTGVTKV